MPFRLLSYLSVGSPDAPRQLLRVTAAEGEHDSSLELRGEGVRLVEPVTVAAAVLEVPLVVSAPAGGTVPFVLALGEQSLEVAVEEPGWTMFMVSPFHHDPVWWNTQAAHTSPWELLSADGTTRPLPERNAFALVEAHLELALRDPDHRLVPAEVGYLKPFFDTHPERRADLRALPAEGRVELIGGTYNEPHTSLTGTETTIRNLVHGIGHQRGPISKNFKQAKDDATPPAGPCGHSRTSGPTPTSRARSHRPIRTKKPPTARIRRTHHSTSPHTPSPSSTEPRRNDTAGCRTRAESLRAVAG